MAASLIGDLKGIFSVKDKERVDPHTDQYSRLFMVKILLLSSVAVGLNWFKDKLTCIVPGSNGISGGFISEACWINGFYVYREILHFKNNLGYYGIPNDINNDGMYPNGKLCQTVSSDGNVDAACLPMTKTFFLQYQWYPFFLAALTLLYYLPYMAYKIVNSDMTSLRKSVEEGDDEGISKNFFNYKINSLTRMRIRVLLNLLIKACYLIANVASFILIDKTLYGLFKSYGKRWFEWIGLPRHIMYDYIYDRSSSKPGEIMLPTFGLCEVLEGARDARHTINNQHKFICEYSPNVLYHYVLIFLWALLIIGIVISTIGFILGILNYIFIGSGGFVKSPRAKKLSSILSLREGEYLELLRKKNRGLYDAVVDRLFDERFEPAQVDYPEQNPSEKAPMYPELRKRLHNMNEGVNEAKV